MGYAFISYSTKNQTQADAMRNLLSKNGIRTWMAPYDIPVGSQYAQVISQALKGCDCLVLMLSRDSQNSVWVGKEVERAVHYRKPIFPVQLEEVVLNDAFELYISTDQLLPVRKVEENSREIRKLLLSILTCLEQTVPEQLTRDTSAPVAADLKMVRTFASCGMEGTVFRVSREAERLTVKVNFEKTRIRDQIPAYGGIYWLFQPALDVCGGKQLQFRARARGILEMQVELKPRGKAWMHEVFPVSLTENMEAYTISLSECVNPDTLACLEEITFVWTPESFADEEYLTGVVELADIEIV